MEQPTVGAVAFGGADARRSAESSRFSRGHRGHGDGVWHARATARCVDIGRRIHAFAACRRRKRIVGNVVNARRPLAKRRVGAV
jgi:hypothetical protein